MLALNCAKCVIMYYNVITYSGPSASNHPTSHLSWHISGCGAHAERPRRAIWRLHNRFMNCCRRRSSHNAHLHVYENLTIGFCGSLETIELHVEISGCPDILSELLATQHDHILHAESRKIKKQLYEEQECLTPFIVCNQHRFTAL